MKRLTACFLMIVLFSGCGEASKDKTEAFIETGQEVYLEETTPSSALSTADLQINRTPEKYTYENLEEDIEKIRGLCGNSVRIEALCKTHDGRNVYDLLLGDPQGENQILIFGSMHAREYITTQVVMRQFCDAMDALNGYIDASYNGIPLCKLLEDTTIHFIPMVNPDGVSISQNGLAGIQNADIRNMVMQTEGTNYTAWKANANGVDLNRNFDAGWAEFVGTPSPGPDRFKGAFPGSEPESAALIHLTKAYPIKRTISYHTCGALIYWYYKQENEVLRQSKKFAGRISAETGYPLDGDYTAVDAAGYKDWAVYKMGIPSITIEVGAENGGGIINPVPIFKFQEIWTRNKNVVYAAVYNMKYE